jgi:uncharacterized membrane protein YkvA (DUF1232 family)
MQESFPRRALEPYETAMFDRARQLARGVKRDVVAIWLAARDPRTPWYVKVLAAIVAAYALSPVDLIPDFIPVLGYLDDLLLVPVGILLVVRMIPADLMREFRQEALRLEGKPKSRVGVAIVVGIWLLGGGLLLWLLWPNALTTGSGS